MIRIVIVIKIMLIKILNEISNGNSQVNNNKNSSTSSNRNITNAKDHNSNSYLMDLSVYLYIVYISISHHMGAIQALYQDHEDRVSRTFHYGNRVSFLQC